MAYITGKTLPDDYFKLDYIEATGLQRIDTGVNALAKWEFTIQFTDPTYRQLMGYSSSKWCYWGIMDDGTYEAEWISINGIKARNRDHVIHDYETQTISVNGSSIPIAEIPAVSSNYHIFSLGTGFKCKAKLWNCRCVQNGVLIRDFVPAMNSSGTTGLYDLVNDVFYTDPDGGTFKANIAANSKLPVGITELDYIRSTGTQYIDTGYVYKQIPTAEIDYATETHKNSEIFGWGAKETYSFLVNDDLNGYEHRLDFWNGSTWNTAFTNLPNLVRSRNRMMFAKNGAAFDILQNGMLLGSVTNANDFSGNAYTARVFSGRSTTHHVGRLYGAKLWDNGTLVRNLVPCKVANGTIGMYDLVGFKFYGNAGTGSFIAGPSLSDLPAEFTRLDYIQSTGTQYINTGIIGNATEKFELRMDVAYTLNKPSGQIHQIMGFNGHAGNGIGLADRNWWEASTLSPMMQNQHVHAEWYLQGTNWYRNANGMSLSGTNGSASSATAANLNLFATHESSSNLAINYWCYCKMFSAQILINDQVVRNFIPCLNPSGTIGLYDSIGNIFYANNGTGQFIGPTNGGLPVGYLPVEYIQSFGAQWLNSEVKIATNTWIEADLMFSSAFGYNMMFGQWDNLALSLKAENEVCMGVGGGSTQNLGSPTVSNVKYNFIVGPGQGLIQNGTRYAIGGNTNDTSVDGPIFIFAASDGGAPYQPWSWSGYGQGKIYNLKIYEGTTGNVETSKLRRHFIPCITSAGIPGMYDLVEQKFHFNKGTGAFAAGPIVSALAHGYTKLTAIESTGTQYINTQYCPATENLMYVLDFKQSPIGANTSLFGSEYNGDGSSRQWSITGYESGGGDISYYVGASHAVSADYPTANVRHRLLVHANNGTFRHDLDASSKTVTYAGSLLKSYPIGLFANNAENTYHQRSLMQTYAFQISDGGVLVRAFTPSMNASGEGGLYDYITGLFFGNGGTGSLIPRSPISDAIKHKTLVNGTAYEIIGGRAMVDGTIHDLINGRTLVNGTAYSIPLRANVIEITLNTNGGAGGTSKIYYHYGKNAFFSDPECWNPLTQIVAPTKTGYTFMGYNGNGSNGADASETYIFSDLSFSSNLCNKIYKSTTLTAQWGENVYTISFDANGGSINTASKAAQYNKAIGTLPTPTRSGYYFIGWYDANYKDDPWLYYAEAPNNGDLINAFGYDRLKLAQHYWEYGLNESWRRKTQHIASDIYTTDGNSTFYAGWAPIFTITQSVYNASDYSDSKDLAWDDYEGYRTITINGSGDLAAHSGSQSAIYGQKIYILAANKYSKRLSNIYINSVQPSDVQYRTWTEVRRVMITSWPFFEDRTFTVDAAEWSGPINSNWKVDWTFDTEGDIFSLTGSPQAFWDCSISTNQ